MHLSAATLTSHITYTQTGYHQSLPIPPAESPAVPFRTCTPHDQPSLRYSVEDILQIVLRNRKNWKTLKGKSEAVWPPYLEATMLMALQEYEPDDSRETRMLGRYPMRNRFISDYIHSTTGKYRSAKQVGSRLQQLRDTSEGRELIDVLTGCYRTRMNAGTCNARQPTTWDSPSSPPVSTISCDRSSPCSSSGSPATPTPPVTPTSPTMRPFPSPKARQPAEPRMPVYIDIVPQQSHSSSTARHIRNIDPTVTFVSPSRVNGKSSYIVLLDGAPVHSEDTTLEYVGPYFTSSTGRSSGEEPVLYNTPLVPKYWDVLCGAADPTLYTIVQDVHRVPDPVPNQDYGQRPRPARIFSAIYHFQYHTSGDSGSSYEQPAAEVSKSGSSMTSAFGEQTLQGSILDPGTTTTFPMSTTYGVPMREIFRTPGEVDQNLFDEPFMLDVSLEEMAFDDFVASMDNPNTFFM
ncbi:hypothetical protein JVT61DRAFT_722 [Boletus reticuloceps]|uniref:TEA domain-containing protein n=1 Tax=Boletus reticuloceps TaxID=495285 RepID=A0A8I2YZ47_9AGAM|nr:hypothetical protein JVT61DRAFT_722 [Boletus reticuloceps]